MDFSQLVKSRRSIREYAAKEIEDDKVKAILEAAMWAPSAGNRQARDFILVKEEQAKKKIAHAALDQDFISDAPMVVVVCANRKRSAERYGRRGQELYSVQDASAAVQNMLLAAHSLGLGACWVGAFDEEALKDVLGIPEDASPVAILPMGYPDESPQPPRRSIAVHEGRW